MSHAAARTNDIKELVTEFQSLKEWLEDLKAAVSKTNETVQELQTKTTDVQSSVNELRLKAAARGSSSSGGGGGGGGGGSGSGSDDAFDFVGVAQARALLDDIDFKFPLRPISIGAVRVIMTGASSAVTSFGNKLLVRDISKGRRVDAPRILEYIVHFAVVNKKGACRRSRPRALALALSPSHSRPRTLALAPSPSHPRPRTLALVTHLFLTPLLV